MGRKPTIALTGLLIGLTLTGCYGNRSDRRLVNNKNTPTGQPAAQSFDKRPPTGISTGQQPPVHFPKDNLQPTNPYKSSQFGQPGQQTNTHMTTHHQLQQQNPGQPGLQQHGGIQPSPPPNTLQTPTPGVNPALPNRPVIGQTPPELPDVDKSLPPHPTGVQPSNYQPPPKQGLPTVPSDFNQPVQVPQYP